MQAKALADGGTALHHATAILNRCIAAEAVEVHRRRFACSLGAQVHRTADSVAIYVGLQCLIDLNRLHQVAGDSVQFDLAHAGFRRGDGDTVHHDVGQARLGAANLYVLAFAFIALKRHARHAAQGVGDVGVGKAGDDLRGQHLQDVIGSASAVDGLGFAALALREHGDLIVFALNLDDRF